MNSPENRYDSDGWLCQYESRLRSTSGRAQERRVGRRRAAEHEVIAAAGAGVAAVDHELLGDQAGLTRRSRTDAPCARPALPSSMTDGCSLRSRRVGRHAELLQTRVARRLVAFEDHRLAERLPLPLRPR